MLKEKVGELLDEYDATDVLEALRDEILERAKSDDVPKYAENKLDYALGNKIDYILEKLRYHYERYFY